MKSNRPEWEFFVRRIYVQATLQEVYRNWATGHGLETWFLSSAKFFLGKHLKTDTELAEEGNNYQWKWLSDDKFTGKGIILHANHVDFLQFTFLDDQTSVTIKLQQKTGRVLVELRQEHRHRKSADRKKLYLACYAPWSFFLTNLRSILEDGPDFRERNPDVKELVNS